MGIQGRAVHTGSENSERFEKSSEPTVMSLCSDGIKKPSPEMSHQARTISIDPMCTLSGPIVSVRKVNDTGYPIWDGAIRLSSEGVVQKRLETGKLQVSL